MVQGHVCRAVIALLLLWYHSQNAKLAQGTARCLCCFDVIVGGEISMGDGVLISPGHSSEGRAYVAMRSIDNK